MNIAVRNITTKSEFKDSAVGPIPTDWEVRDFCDVIRIATGQVDPKFAPYCNMVLVAPDHVQEATGHLIARVTAKEQHAISGKYQFRRGDIVYSKIRPYLRKLILADFDGLCSADMYALTPRPGVNAAFCFYSMQHDRFSNFAIASSARSGIPKINREELAQFKFALPPPKEQEAIATALCDADAVVASLDALIAKKQDIKQAAMQQLLTGKTRLPGFKAKWETTTLGECLLERPSYGINSPAVPYASRLPRYIRITDISEDGRFIQPEVVCVANPSAERYLLDNGDLLFARTGASVGKSYLYKSSDGPLVYAGFLIRAKPDPKKVVPAFLFALANTPRYWAWVKVMSLRSGQPGINGNEYAQFPIPLPTLSEQSAIATILCDIDAELVALETEREKVRDIKRGMMQELLTGRIRLVAGKGTS